MQVDKQEHMEGARPMDPSSPSGSRHLDAERLAAFDEAPWTAEENAHLAGCASCRAEQEAHMALQALARDLRRRDAESDAPRLVAWEAIAEGLQQPEPSAVPRGRAAPPARRAVLPSLRRAAAAVVLLTGGAVLGRLSGNASSGGTAEGAVASATVSNTTRPVALDAPLAADGYATVEQATAELARAQRDYERASLWLAANDTTVRDSDVYRARLAALDQMMAASRAALRDAPQDPMLNHYFLAAYTAREATLQQLGGALPVDKTIERY